MRKARDLVFDRRTVTWPDPFDSAGEHWRTIEPTADDRVGTLVGVCYPAIDLPRVHCPGAHEREHRRWIVARLRFQCRKVDRAAIEARRGTRFQAPGGQIKCPQPRA